MSGLIVRQHARAMLQAVRLLSRAAMMKAGLILLTTVAMLMAVVLCVTHLINKRTFHQNSKEINSDT